MEVTDRGPFYVHEHEKEVCNVSLLLTNWFKKIGRAHV